jgi:hypothetical protein
LRYHILLLEGKNTLGRAKNPSHGVGTFTVL